MFYAAMIIWGIGAAAYLGFRISIWIRKARLSRRRQEGQDGTR